MDVKIFMEKLNVVPKTKWFEFVFVLKSINNTVG